MSVPQVSRGRAVAVGITAFIASVEGAVAAIFFMDGHLVFGIVWTVIALTNIATTVMQARSIWYAGILAYLQKKQADERDEMMKRVNAPWN